jgi:hypothetical protein
VKLSAVFRDFERFPFFDTGSYRRVPRLADVLLDRAGEEAGRGRELALVERLDRGDRLRAIPVDVSHGYGSLRSLVGSRQ